VTTRTPVFSVVALDQSLLADKRRVVDRNALADVADRVRGDGGTVLVLDRCEIAGRTLQSTLRSTGREHRPLIYQAVGIVPVLQGLMREFDAHGVRCGLLNVSRESFADRAQYFAIRDVVRGLLRNDIVPLIVDAGETNGLASVQNVAYLQISALLSGMLGAVALEVHVGAPVAFSGPSGPLRAAMVDEFDGLWRADKITTDAKGKALIEPLLAAARLVAYSGATITVLSAANTDVSPNPLLTLSSSRDQRAMTGVQRWLVAGAVPEGAVIVSEYAATRLTRESRGSLLAAGVVRS